MRTRTVDEQKHERLMMDCIKMLSALESWSFADKHRMPDYLLESLNDLVVRLEEEILK